MDVHQLDELIGSGGSVLSSRGDLKLIPEVLLNPAVVWSDPRVGNISFQPANEACAEGVRTPMNRGSDLPPIVSFSKQE